MTKESGRKGWRVEPLPLFRGTPLAKGVVLVPDTCYILRKEPGSDLVDSPSNQLNQSSREGSGSERSRLVITKYLRSKPSA